jgi:hypothetical protein
MKIFLNNKPYEAERLGPFTPGKPVYIDWHTKDRPKYLAIVTDEERFKAVPIELFHHKGVFITDYGHDWSIYNAPKGNRQLKYHGPGVGLDAISEYSLLAIYDKS